MKDIIIIIIDNLENNGIEVTDEQALKYAQEFWQECKDEEIELDNLDTHLQQFIINLISELQEEKK